MLNKNSFWIVSLGLLALPGTALAQLQRGTPRPMPGQARDGGTYHVASGTWTRKHREVVMAGPDVIYDNTCTVGYYFGLPEGDVILDSGRIPSTTSPTGPESLTGWADNYTVTGFEIGYCVFNPGAADIDVSFADCYTPCLTTGILPEPTAVFHLVNAPGTGPGSQNCWVITIDLTNTSQTFDLGGDCNGVYNNVASTDSFAWTWTLAEQTVAADAGPLLAGDPSGLFPQSGQTCGGAGAGTSFVGASPGAGTGIGIQDTMQLGEGPTYPSCFWFGGYGGAGGNPFTAFYMQLRGELASGAPDNQGSSFCHGTNSGCPCWNWGSHGGCTNSSVFWGARLVATGNGSLASGEDTLQFHVTNASPGRPGLLLRGDNQLNGGAGITVGDGLLCIGGGSQRSQVIFTTTVGSAHIDDWHGAGFGSVANQGVPTHFQFWYRDPGGACGTGFNFSNGWSVTY